jgi:hypothetical protein
MARIEETSTERAYKTNSQIGKFWKKMHFWEREGVK